MSEWKILIYDGNQGQFRAGLGPWENLADWKKQSLLEQDKDAPLKVQSLEELFYGLNVQWKEVTTYEECEESISDVNILVVFKGCVDRQLLNRSFNLEEIHVLGYHSAKIDKEELEVFIKKDSGSGSNFKTGLVLDGNPRKCSTNTRTYRRSARNRGNWLRSHSIIETLGDPPSIS